MVKQEEMRPLISINVTLIHLTVHNQNTKIGGQRAGSVVKKAYYSYRNPNFDF